MTIEELVAKMIDAIKGGMLTDDQLAMIEQVATEAPRHDAALRHNSGIAIPEDGSADCSL